MRNRLLLVTVAVVGLGLLTASSIKAQQSTNKNSQSEDSFAKPCILVHGAVRSPARFELQRRVRLAEAIEMAGGANENAIETIQVTHAQTLNCEQRNGQVVSGCIDCRLDTMQPPPAMSFYKLSELHSQDEKANPYLRSGDIVMVVEAPPVYVVGSVVAPQTLHLGAKMTLTQAIAMVGGVLRDSNIKKVRIFRSNSDSTVAIIRVDLNAINKHRSEDLILQPYDIIEVPAKGLEHGMSLVQFPLRVIGYVPGESVTFRWQSL